MSPPGGTVVLTCSSVLATLDLQDAGIAKCWPSKQAMLSLALLTDAGSMRRSDVTFAARIVFFLFCSTNEMQLPTVASDKMPLSELMMAIAYLCNAPRLSQLFRKLFYCVFFLLPERRAYNTCLKRWRLKVNL